MGTLFKVLVRSSSRRHKKRAVRHDTVSSSSAIILIRTAYAAHQFYSCNNESFCPSVAKEDITI